MSGHGSKRWGQRVTNLQPTGRMEDVRHVAWNDGEPLGLGAVDARNRAEQPLRVGVERIAKQLANRRDFLNLAAVHHRHPVARFGDDRQVVGDEEDRGAGAPRLQLQHQIENLRLNRHVQRRRRLVGDDERRVQHQRHRDHHALAHAAREMVRVLLHPRRRVGDAHFGQDGDRARVGVVPAALGLVREDHFGDLHADREHRVQRRHRLLEHHADVVAANRPDLVPRQLQQVASVEADLARDDPARRIGDQAQHAQRRDALAGPRFADQAEHLAWRTSRSTPSTALATPDSVSK